MEVFTVNWLENTRSMHVHFQVINIKTAIKVEVFTVNWLEKFNEGFKRFYNLKELLMMFPAITIYFLFVKN